MEGTNTKSEKGGRAGRNVELVKWLQCEHEGLHSIPRTQVKNKAQSSGWHMLITLARESDSLIAKVH